MSEGPRRDRVARDRVTSIVIALFIAAVLPVKISRPQHIGKQSYPA